MQVRLLRSSVVIGLFLILMHPTTVLSADEGSIPPQPKGAATIGLIAGPFFPIRLEPHQSSKLFGGATALSSSFILTNPLGSGWYQGQFSLGAEILGFSTSQPIGASGLGLTPKIVFTFTSLDRFRPYVEGGVGPMWTDLGGRVPEQPGQFNFLTWGGMGCLYVLTPRWAITAGYRFVHISNADIRRPNSGLQFGMPFLGVSYTAF